MQEPIASRRNWSGHAALFASAFIEQHEWFGKIVESDHEGAWRVRAEDDTGELHHDARAVREDHHKLIGSRCGEAPAIHDPGQTICTNETCILFWSDDFERTQVLAKAKVRLLR